MYSYIELQKHNKTIGKIAYTTENVPAIRELIRLGYTLGRIKHTKTLIYKRGGQNGD